MLGLSWACSPHLLSPAGSMILTPVWKLPEFSERIWSKSAAAERVCPLEITFLFWNLWAWGRPGASSRDRWWARGDPLTCTHRLGVHHSQGQAAHICVRVHKSSAVFRPLLSAFSNRPLKSTVDPLGMPVDGHVLLKVVFGSG